VPRLSEEAVASVKAHADLAALIGDTVALKPSGSGRLIGLCPFHTEDTASFSVNADRGFAYCFGCTWSGDVFAFVMETYGVTFPEAVVQVAERFGIEMPEAIDTAPLAPLRAAVAAAQAYFRAQLRSPKGAHVCAYLATRGISEAVIEQYGIGYAPSMGLAEYLRRAKVLHATSITVGTLRENDGGAPYDAFRERVIFPIHDPSGRVIAFAGRVLPGAPPTAPKYINSPESPLFTKGRTLYGFPFARDAARRSGRLWLVEGQLDVLAMVGAGYPNTAASCGTALTVEQVGMVRRIVKDLVVVYDGDAAGQKAAARAFEICVKGSVWGLGVTLPADSDPAALALSGGLTEALQHTVPLCAAFVNHLPTEGLWESRQGVEHVARLYRSVPDSLDRDLLTARTASALDVRLTSLRALIQATPLAPATGADLAHADLDAPPAAVAMIPQLHARRHLRTEQLAAMATLLAEPLPPKAKGESDCSPSPLSLPDLMSGQAAVTIEGHIENGAAAQLPLASVK